MLAEWDAEHDGLHGYGTMRAELDRRFAGRLLSPEPFLHRLLDGATEAEERALIERGAIRAVGFRYVGRRAARA